MKQIILLVFTVFSFVSYSQTNELTTHEFYNIKINSIFLQDIIDTHGVEYSVESTLGFDLDVKKGDLPDYWIEFHSTKYMLLFQDGKRFNGVIKDYQLTDFLIKSNSVNFSIKGKQIKIGDNISKLGSTKILTYKDGRKEIVYKIGVQVIEIGFNPITKVITKIKYVCYTT